METWWTSVSVFPGLPKLLCGVGKLTKFGLHAGNMKVNTQTEDYISRV
jgi:hypothetical protein